VLRVVAAIASLVLVCFWENADAQQPEFLLAVADIASCDNDNDEATAAIADAQPGEIVILGDLAYPNGTATDFTNCYDPTWGRHKDRTHPSPGNHEYNTPNAGAYYSYFGSAAGDPAEGYYSFDLGDWHIIAINSNCAFIGGCHAGSEQEQWLREDLAATSSDCILAFWHHPRFSSSDVHGDQQSMEPIWQALYDARADVVLSGHDHDYERFAKQDPDGTPDAEGGIREFVVGTGGRSLYPVTNPGPNSEAHADDTYGILKMTLYKNAYDWEFLPIEGSAYTDSGTAACSSASVGGQSALAAAGDNPMGPTWAVIAATGLIALVSLAAVALRPSG
jgi:hypothetical protein